MSEVLLILKNFTVNNAGLVTWTVFCLILVLALVSQRTWINEYINECKLENLLKNAGNESLHNVTISDGIEGKIFIEYLILTPKNIFLLGVKKYQGLIFAADKIDLWTQVVGNKSYKFENPLRQLESDALALSAKIKNSKVVEKVLFISGSEFPKGKPDNIVAISDIEEWSRSCANTEVSKELHADWESLSELVARNDFKKDVLIDENNSSELNLFSLITILSFALFWLVWRLAQ